MIVDCEEPPSKLLNALKSHSSRALAAVEQQTRQRWSRGGSARHLWNAQEVDRAVEYAVHEQGEPMAVYETVDRWRNLRI